MKPERFLVGLLSGLVVGFAVTFMFTMPRYTFLPAGENTGVFKCDRVNGQVWVGAAGMKWEAVGK